MAMVRGVLCDVDGTLIDSNDAHARAFVQAFRENGLEIAFEKVRPLIGKGGEKLMPEVIYETPGDLLAHFDTSLLKGV